MSTKFTLIKRIFMLALFTSSWCYAQSDDAQVVMIEFKSLDDNWINTTTLNTNRDIKLNLEFTKITDYTITAKLSDDTAIDLSTKSFLIGGDISYSIPRREFNKPGITGISFVITQNSDSKFKKFDIKLNPVSLAVGNIIDDAIALRNAKDDDQLIIDILSFYANKQLDYNGLQSLIANNPYLNQVIATTSVQPYHLFSTTGIDNKAKGVLIQKRADGAIAQGGSGLGGIDVTKYANVMADIMIDHAKEELTIAFFNRFKNFIKEHEEFRVLFPKTSDKIESLLSYKYPEMIKALRLAFLDDVRKIAYTIDDVFALPKYQQLTSEYPQITIAIKSLRLIHQLETGGLNAAGVLDVMANFNEWNLPANSSKISNVGNALKTANALNQSISITSNGKSEWHDADKIARFIKDETLFKIYMGLLYEKESNATAPIKFIKSNNTVITFSEVLSNKANDLFFFQNKIQEFIDLTTIVKKTAKDLNDKVTKLSNQGRYAYISNSIDVIEYALSIYNYLDPSIEASGEFIAILKLSNDLYRNIYEEQYNGAISNAADLFIKIAELRKEDIKFTKSEIEAIKGTVKGLSLTDNEKKPLYATVDKLSGDSSKISLENITLLTEKTADAKLHKLREALKSSTLITFIEKAKPFALFMANVIEAKDEKEVKAALDAAILPVGSSTIKKYSAINFAVQSYLGARFNSSSANKSSPGTWGDNFGVSAPIGLSVSRGLRKGGSLSLFLPLLDLAAVVDYKLKDKGTTDANGNAVVEKEYKVELGQIFSPGAYLVYGLPYDLPISLGFGGQYGPGLSKIDNTNTVSLEDPYWRWNFFLSVDIPLFNLTNRPYDKSAEKRNDKKKK